MRPCPVCDSPVMESVCEVCGKQLGLPSVPAPPTPPMEGLEPTQVEVPAGQPLALDPTPGLEPTGVAAVPEIPGEALLGWEATAGEPLPEPPVGDLLDLDRGRISPELGPVAVPGPRTCRYCRNVQPEGLLCERCGMRLPALPEGDAPEAAAQAMEELIRCPRCGERTPSGWERCGGCGAVLRAASS